MVWEKPGCNGGDCCKYYNEYNNFRIVTNGYEFKVQEKFVSFWKGRLKWVDCTCDAWESPIYFKTIEDAKTYMMEREKLLARSGKWERVEI